MPYKNLQDALAYNRDSYNKDRKRHIERGKRNVAKLRSLAQEKLGSRCASVKCRYLNSDGTFGCTDPLLLQIDHVNGGGTKEIKLLNKIAYLKKVIADTEGNYQLLCANCNWLKRYTNKEFKFSPDSSSGKTRVS